MAASSTRPRGLSQYAVDKGRVTHSPSRLTRKEVLLLEILRQHSGQCLSRDYLLRTVWGYREGVKTRTVDVHIQRLRRKLGPEGLRHIKTIFRAGYVWFGSAGSRDTSDLFAPGAVA
jgi:DNA-binding response OmpR family regulator